MSTYFHRFRSGLVFLGLFFAATSAAQVLTPPRVHWIGPEAECDFISIQAALDEVFDCGIFACPPGRNELRLSSNYDHSGQVVINRTFDIRGGFDVCEGQATGLRANLQAPNGDSLFLVEPGEAPIDNELRELSLTGGLFTVNRGGVIHMAQGDARLTLNDTIVRNATANSGGGLYLSGMGNHLVLNDAQIFSNTATEGGGVFCTNGGLIDFQSGRIDGNEATLSGGGLYLQAQCELKGQTSGQDRQINGNTVSDIQRGQGAGIFSLFSTITLGAVLSRTSIESNIVTTFEPDGVGPSGVNYILHEFGTPGQNNRGGGVHLAASNATFLNTRFRLNEAADGGAISVVGDSQLLVDRTSGPCEAANQAVDCSLMEANRARGGLDKFFISGFHQEAGDGAAVFASDFLGQTPVVKIQRTVVRFNRASCFEASTDDFTGECDFPGITSGGQSEASVFYAELESEMQLHGSLVYGNDTGDADDCDFGSCVKSAYLMRGVSQITSSTIVANSDMDALMFFPDLIDRSKMPDIVNSLIFDEEPDQLTSFRYLNFVSCNLTNFAAEMNLAGNSIPITNQTTNPQFVNPDPSDSPNEDFQIVDENSPAIDRCDDAGGLITSTHDIAGNPRKLNIGGITHGPGEYDAGAFERVPDDYVNNTTDLNVDIQSNTPKQAALGEAHDFTISVNNSGHNGVTDLDVDIGFDLADATLEDLRGVPVFDPTGNQIVVWNCLAAEARCRRLANVSPGTVTSPIIASLSFASGGAKQVTAEVKMNDETLVELTDADNVDTDTVTVGAGADLAVNLISAAPREVMINEPQLLIFNVENLGPETANQARVHLTAPGAEISFFSGNSWICDNLNRQCVHTEPLPPTGTTFSSFTAELRYDQPGNKTLIAQIMAAGGPGDPDPDNNRDEDFVDVLFPPTDELFTDSFEFMQ